MREKRVIGLIIAATVAIITAIATMDLASVALSQSIQNPHCVNTLTKMSPATFNKCI
jgi:hypothetical protein